MVADDQHGNHFENTPHQIIFIDEALNSPQHYEQYSQRKSQLDEAERNDDHGHQAALRQRITSEIHEVQDANQIQLIHPSDERRYVGRSGQDTPDYNIAMDAMMTLDSGSKPSLSVSQRQNQDEAMNAAHYGGSIGNYFEFKDNSSRSLEDFDVGNQQDSLPGELFVEGGRS